MANYSIERDVKPPKNWSETVFGWDFNSHRDDQKGQVFKAWTSASSHGEGDTRSRISGGSKGAVPLYSTRRRALVAMRADMESRHAERMAAIDKQIFAEPKE